MRSLLLSLFLAATGALAQDLALERVTGGLAGPVGIVSAGDSRLFVVLQGGQIAIWDGTRIATTSFLDLRGRISTGGERGLLGLAFHPHYASNGRFFVDYTAPNGDVTIARYNVSASDPNRADPNSGVVLLTIPHSQFANHNGGQLQFGPDGYLYVGVGDGGSGGDPNNNGQNLAQLLGKILRIDVDGDSYAIPPSNPFVNRAGARGEIWAYGLRNPWRFSFDRDTSDLWIGDVGQNKYEEVDLQPATSIGGEDYGWRVMEGLHCFDPVTNCPSSGLVLPILEYDHSQNRCSITGGYRYRGTRSPRLRGTYIYADYCSGTIYGATPAPGGGWTSRTLLQTSLGITSFGEDANGELYVADAKGNTIYHLADPQPQSPTVRRRAVGH
jgi:hypothetical protein